MASKRVVVLFFVSLLALGAVFAESGSSDPSGGSGFLEVSTPHFKVIYEAECAATAKVIADGCEDEYSQL